MLKGAVEPVPIDDTFLNGIYKVEVLPGDLVRFWLYVEENGQKIIKAKNVFPRSAIVQMHIISRETLAAEIEAGDIIAKALNE